jgi:hypothetical protein
VIFQAGGAPPVLFGVGVSLDGEAHGALAFAGSRGREERFTATDKDVLGLMAQWLSTELERRARATAAPPEPARLPTLEALRPGSGRDLNAAVQRVEHTLRRQVGVDATLELSLHPALPLARGGRLSLSTLVESMVHAAARLAPSGRIHVETRQQSGTGPAEDLVLLVSVKGEMIDARAFERIFAEDDGLELPQAGLPMARLERLLRRDGGDLSVAVEPRRAAVLSAYLPAQRTSAKERTSEIVQPS